MRQHRVAAAVLLGAAALLLTPGTSSAQRFGFGRGYYGGGYVYSPYGWGYSPGYTWGNYNYPIYSTGSYYNAPATSSNYGYPSGTGSSYAYGAPTSTETRDSVLLNVRLPDPNAEVWVEGKRTEQRGTSREFVSPPLNPDKSYTYEVRARWTENGKAVQRTKSVSVRANRTATVDFTASNNSRVDEIDRDRPRTNPDKGTIPPDKGKVPPDAGGIDKP